MSWTVRWWEKGDSGKDRLINQVECYNEDYTDVIVGRLYDTFWNPEDGLSVEYEIVENK